MTLDKLKAKLKTAFARVEPPPHWFITDCNEGEEPALLQQEFAEIPHWNSLSPTFLNQTPNGYGSALSFFSDEVSRYYLPASKAMSKEWFHWYVKQVVKPKRWATFGGRFLCPCCFMPTLDERAGYDICPICFWEDDGQDSDDADVIRGGPNHGYSLSEARSNFVKHHTMYRQEDTMPFEREMADMPFKKELYGLYAEAIKTGDLKLFQRAVALQESRYEDDEDQEASL